MDKILAEISAGELIDKITILEIKKEKISNKEKLIEVDKINPITASRIVKFFSKWKTYVDKNKEEMYKSILKINKANISSNTREVVELILK